MKAIVIVITLFPLSLFAQYQQSTQFDFPSYTGNGGAVLGTWGSSINKNGDVSGTVEIRDPFSQITYQCFLRTLFFHLTFLLAACPPSFTVGLAG